MTNRDLSLAKQLWRKGLGWEDICRELKLNSVEAREHIRKLVLRHWPQEAAMQT